MPITPTDKKMIKEADEHVVAHLQTIRTLDDMSEMSKKAWGFKGSSPASKVLSPFNQGAQDTLELNTTATTNALQQLKTIFGGAPTEGERQILLDIQGSSAMPDAVRQKVYTRAKAAVERNLEFAQKQAMEMRDRSYWKPGGGSTRGQAPPAGAVEQLQANPSPEMRRFFDATFGAGAAARALGGK